MAKQWITPISEEDRNAVKRKSAAVLPNSPSDYGMKAGATKPKFWQALIQGDDSLAGLLDRTVGEINGLLGDGTGASELLNALCTQYNAETDDKRRLTLAAWIERAESALKEAAERTVEATPEDEGKVLTVENGKAVWKEPTTPEGDICFGIGPGLLFDTESNTLSVDTADAAEKDNTRPITAAAVYIEIGNIDALLGTI